MNKADKKRMSIDNMRVGKKYCLVNYGDTTRFTILDSTAREDFTIKDLLSMETYRFSELIEYGIGPDFELFEI